VPKVTREMTPYSPHPSGQGSPSTPHVVFDRIRIAVLLHRTFDGTKKTGLALLQKGWAW
jgi:hypothetical protein